MINKNNIAQTLIITGFLITSGGVSAYAEKSVPGEVFYPVKIYLNEPIASIFSFTKEEKTEWQERLVERRLEEIQKLAFKDQLTETKRNELVDKIKNQIGKFSVDVNELALRNGQSINSSDLNIRLEASLQAYKNTLSDISTYTNLSDTTKQETVQMVSDLEESLVIVKQNYESLGLNVGVDSINNTTQKNTTSSPTQSTTDNLNKAEDKRDASLKLLNSLKLSYQKEKVYLPANIQTQIDSNLAEAEDNMGLANTAIGSSDFTSAVNAFQAVINKINETKLLMLSNIMQSKIEYGRGSDDKNSGTENTGGEHDQEWGDE